MQLGSSRVTRDRWYVEPVRALAMAVVIAGCSANGRALEEWTFSTAGRSHDIKVKLPSTLHELPACDLTFTMRADVALRPDERGHDLTLELDCFHGSLVLHAGDVTLPDLGDSDAGAHRFVIPASVAARESLSLAAEGHKNIDTCGWGISAAPRLVIGTLAQESSIAIFNRDLALTSSVLVSLMALIFGTLYALDRRRRADAVFAIACAAALPMTLFEIGVAPVWMFGAGMCVIATSILYFLHFEFSVRPPPRALVLTYVVIACLFAISPLGFTVGRIAVVSLNLLASVTYFHFYRMLLQVRRSEARRSDAWTLIIATAVSILAFTPIGITAVISVPSLLGAVHIEDAGLVSWMIALALVLARQHVARHRSLEVATAELQRQVAERSRDLADALTKLATRPVGPLEELRVIGRRYRVIRRLGAGGMGTVYEVARTTDEQRFAREAQIAAELAHPNLVPVLDVGLDEASLFIVMPLIHGGSLEELRPRFGDPAWARKHLAEIAHGLSALHERKIMHRDLKPANVLIDRGVARIADFGLATTGGDGGTQMTSSSNVALDDTMANGALTHTGAVFGTPKYMAPELVDGVHDYAPSADIFSLGLIAHEMLTGRPAFATPPFVAAQEGRTYAAPSPEGLDPLVRRCLDADAAKRPTAAELAVKWRDAG